MSERSKTKLAAVFAVSAGLLGSAFLPRQVPATIYTIGTVKLDDRVIEHYLWTDRGKASINNPAGFHMGQKILCVQSRNYLTFKPYLHDCAP
jgi:hypothetical protein